MDAEQLKTKDNSLGDQSGEVGRGSGFFFAYLIVGIIIRSRK